MTLIDMKYITHVNGIKHGKRKMDTYNIVRDLPVEIDSIESSNAPLVALKNMRDRNHPDENYKVIPFRRYEDELYSPVMNYYKLIEHKAIFSLVEDRHQMPDDVGYLMEHINKKTTGTLSGINVMGTNQLNNIILNHFNDDSLLKYADEDDFKIVFSHDEQFSLQSSLRQASNFLMIDGILYEKSAGLFTYVVGYVKQNKSIDIPQSRSDILSVDYLPMLLSYIQLIKKKEYLDYTVNFSSNHKLQEKNFIGYYIDDITFLDAHMRKGYGRQIIHDAIHHSVKKILSTKAMSIETRKHEIQAQSERILDKYGLRDIMQQCKDNNYDIDFVRMAVDKLMATDLSTEPGYYMGDKKGRSNMPSDMELLNASRHKMKKFLNSVDVSYQVPDDRKLNLFVDGYYEDTPFRIPTISSLYGVSPKPGG